MITSVRVPWTGGVIHALHVAANVAQPRFVAVFVHGADREFQNAEHWRSHLPALAFWRDNSEDLQRSACTCFLSIRRSKVGSAEQSVLAFEQAPHPKQSDYEALRQS